MAHAPKLLARPLLPPPVPDVVKHPHVPRITLVSTLIARNPAHILQLPPLPSAGSSTPSFPSHSSPSTRLTLSVHSSLIIPRQTSRPYRHARHASLIQIYRAYPSSVGLRARLLASTHCPPPSVTIMDIDCDHSGVRQADIHTEHAKYTPRSRHHVRQRAIMYCVRCTYSSPPIGPPLQMRGGGKGTKRGCTGRHENAHTTSVECPFDTSRTLLRTAHPIRTSQYKPDGLRVRHEDDPAAGGCAPTVRACRVAPR